MFLYRSVTRSMVETPIVDTATIQARACPRWRWRVSLRCGRRSCACGSRRTRRGTATSRPAAWWRTAPACCPTPHQHGSRTCSPSGSAGRARDGTTSPDTGLREEGVRSGVRRTYGRSGARGRDERRVDGPNGRSWSSTAEARTASDGWATRTSYNAAYCDSEAVISWTNGWSITVVWSMLDEQARLLQPVRRSAAVELLKSSITTAKLGLPLVQSHTMCTPKHENRCNKIHAIKASRPTL